MGKSSTVFVGMDVHKESIEIALADEGEVRRFGKIGGDAGECRWRGAQAAQRASSAAICL
jgi:hypothetical protein